MMEFSFIENDDNDNSNNNSNINSTNHTLQLEQMKAIPIHFPKVCNVNTNYDLSLVAPFELITPTESTNREQYSESSSINVFPLSFL